MFEEKGFSNAQGIESCVKSLINRSVARMVRLPRASDRASLSLKGFVGRDTPHGSAFDLMTLVRLRATDHDVHGVANIAATMRTRRASLSRALKTLRSVKSYCLPLRMSKMCDGTL